MKKQSKPPTRIGDVPAIGNPQRKMGKSWDMIGNTYYQYLSIRAYGGYSWENHWKEIRSTPSD